MELTIHEDGKLDSKSYIHVMHIVWVVLLSVAIVYLMVGVGYFFLQERLIFIPAFQRNKDLKLVKPYEQMFFHTANEGLIHSLHIRNQESGRAKRLIIYFHGNTGSMSRWCHLAQELTDFDADVFVFDYRGYGKSKGKRRESWMHRDHQETIQQLLHRFPEYEEVIFYGRSLGSGFAVRAAYLLSPDGLILETPFSSLLNVARYHAPYLPVKWLLRFHMRSDRFIDKIECPILILHGTKDKVVPFSSAYNLFEKIKGKSGAEFVSIPNGKHSNLATFPVFREKIRIFLKAPLT